MEELVIGIDIMLQDDGYMVGNSGTYFKIGKREGRILERVVKGDDKEIIINEESITKSDLEQLFIELQGAGVIGNSIKEKKSLFFYKIPLFQADKLFSLVANFINNKKEIIKKLFFIVNIMAIIGLIFMIKNSREMFLFTSFKMSITEYVLLYVAFFLTVCLHEFAHGTVCRYVGGKVGTVGLMFIFFSPAMYCDISGIRMVENRRKQIIASAAGVYVNTIVMSFSAFIFALTKKPIYAAYSILNFTSIISNLIPVIRLDGYWILSFATGITNLYKKSLMGASKFFSKCSPQERFIAIYGVITYIFMAIILGSFALTIISVTKYIINFII